ncbi:hypothetical protein [Streptomyces sp. TLI_146]|uniref:hypothetical protein n=1 Tax=Streptomyces sp. TLI_146 TaxID=1938858 RepID=UPI000C706199|nr:hypothetical protein [Streptomyces sp. TLI_146]PKV82757.1 hypothetical protein BX283_0206 [Streptomyces sp. TLI_146]
MKADRTVQVSVSHHQYALFNTDAEPPSRQIAERLTGNGLVSVNAEGTYAAVITGAPYGEVEVVFAVSLSEPPLDVDGWDDVVEVSLFFPGLGPMAGDAITDDVVSVPLLGGPEHFRWWRFRFHAVGRDTASCEDPALQERHLIQAWPASRAAESRYKVTARPGARIPTTDPNYVAEAEAAERDHDTVSGTAQTRRRPVLRAVLKRAHGTDDSMGPNP